MNKDQVKGRMQELTGKTKKAAGKVVRDSTLNEKGRIEEAAGKARASYGDAKEELKRDDQDKV